MPDCRSEDCTPVTTGEEHEREVSAALVQEAAQRLPQQREADARRLAGLNRQIENLVEALADGQLSSAAVREKLTKLEMQTAEVKQQLAASEALQAGAVTLPDDAWISEQLRQLTGDLDAE